MVGLMKMLGGMLVLGRIAATNVTANHALSEVHPGVPNFKAFFAALAAWSDLTNFFDMRTAGRLC